MRQQNNHPLRVERLRRGLTQQQLADFAQVSPNTVARAEKGSPLRVDVCRLLCDYLGKEKPEDLGLHCYGLPDSSPPTEKKLIQMPNLTSAREPSVVANIVTSSSKEPLKHGMWGKRATGDQSTFVLLRRQLLEYIFNLASLTILLPTLVPFPEPSSCLAIEELLPRCEADIQVCWRLMEGSEIPTVQTILFTWLPLLDAFVQQSSKYRKQLAVVAAQGYILAGLVAVLQRKYDGAEWCCWQAVEYSRLAEDHNLEVAALKHVATKYCSANLPLKTLWTYQEALPLINKVSPLLQSRIHLGLALAYAQCKEEHEALIHLGLAQDSFPLHPETDPSFSYADCGRSSLNHYGGLIFLEFNRPQQAWETFEEVATLKTQITIPERTVIEIINCQAKAAVAQQDIEQAFAHVTTGLDGALKLGSKKRFLDTLSVYKQMRHVWPHESAVKTLTERFHNEVKHFHIPEQQLEGM